VNNTDFRLFIREEKEMPSASDELRAVMEELFNDPISDQGPISFLESKGHTLTRDWRWKLKDGETLESISHNEFLCIKFLIDEWDFGGIK